MKKTIAITGGIGSGKSTVAKEISLLGFSVFSCDQIYREIMEDKAYITQISSVFDGVVVEGKIDKNALSRLVFSDKTARNKLNSIAHPLIMSTLYACMQNCANDFVFAEVPLLFEGGYEKDFDEIIVVCRNKVERIKSVMDRDGVSEGEALARVGAQIDYDEKMQNWANDKKIHILQNNGGVDDLKFAIQKIIKEITQYET